MQKDKRVDKHKTALHPNNLHNSNYDLKGLTETFPQLKADIITNPRNGQDTIDFSNSESVKNLNKALLLKYYKLTYWDIPKGYLCPPIPGRADYIHYAADLLMYTNNKAHPDGKKIKCLDIGTGSSLIYPIIGSALYDWDFVGTEIDPISVENAEAIVSKNDVLKEKVELRLQRNKNRIFKGVVKREEKFDLVFCNPPFHKSAEEAQKGSLRKLSNLQKKKVTNAKLNFGGQNAELWCDGGEKEFIKNMIKESRGYSRSCFWFTSLVSKQDNLKFIIEILKQANIKEYSIVNMEQGNKISRFIAWTFLNKTEQKNWARDNWNKSEDESL